MLDNLNYRGELFTSLYSVGPKNVVKGCVNGGFGHATFEHVFWSVEFSKKRVTECIGSLSHRVPVRADHDGPVGLRAPLRTGQDPDDVAAGIRLLVVLRREEAAFYRAGKI